MPQTIQGSGAQSFPPSTRFLRELAEGGQFLLEKDPASTLNGVDIVVDTLGDRVRVFEGAAPSRGVHIDLLQGGNGASARLTSTLDFVSNLSSTGWQRLPSGLIMQWILDTSAFTAGVERVLTLPISFSVGIVCATFAPPNTSGSAVLSQRWVSASQIGVTSSASIAGGAGTSIIVFGR